MKAFRTRPNAVSLCRALGFKVLDANGFPIAVFDEANEELVRTKNINARNEPTFDLPNSELLKEYEEVTVEELVCGECGLLLEDAGAEECPALTKRLGGHTGRVYAHDGTFLGEY